MKKVKILAMVAFVAAGLFTTSCSNNDEFAGLSISTNAKAINELRAHSNVPATFVFAGQTKTGTDVIFETETAGGVMTVTADGYFPQTAEIQFTDVNAFANVDIKLVKESSINKSQDEMKGSSITNDSENQSVMGLQSVLSVSNDVNISGNTKDPFSLVVFEPTKKIVDVSKQKVGDVVSVPIVGVRCEPDGAQFDKPVSLSLNLGGCENLDLSCPTAFEGTSVTATAKGVTAQVGHFSYAFIAANAQLIEREDRSVTTKTRVKVKAGKNVFNYNEISGYEADYEDNSAEDKFLQGIYLHRAKTVSRTTEFEASADGYADIETTQYIFDVTYKSKRAYVFATIYGRQEKTATVDGQTIPLYHKGGSSD